MALYTVFGGKGFIGTEIVKQLTDLGSDIFIPERGDGKIFEVDLGTVIYCAGNGDCKNTPFSVLDANVSLLSSVLQQSTFSRLIYVSSTRVYMNQEYSTEQANLTITSADSRKLFNLTKLVGEELCLKSGRETTIIRPSNVYGVALNSPLFLPAITRNAINIGKVDMYIAKEYEKDYVSVVDVAATCIELSNNQKALNQVINVAAGYNVTAQQIADVLQEKTGCEVVWHEISFPAEQFPQTDISLLIELQASYSPANVLDDLCGMIEDFKKALNVNT